MRLFLIISFLLFTGVAESAYVVYDNNTKEIISISPENDAVLETGQKKVMIQDKFKDIKLTAQPTDYKFIDGKFVKDFKKISDRAIANQQSKEKMLEIRKVQRKARKIACKKLEAEGTVFSYINCDDF